MMRQATDRDLKWSGLLTEVRSCSVCAASLPLGANPILSASPKARLMIVSQAPGRRAHHSGVPFSDASGDRLRAWLSMSKESFYDPDMVAIIPMGFCYPGTLANGGDRAPPSLCANLWHGRLIAALPNIESTLLVGRLAQARYYPTPAHSMTEAVQNWRRHWPRWIPLPHPSWRTLGWAKRHSWFERELLPELRQLVLSVLK